MESKSLVNVRVSPLSGDEFISSSKSFILIFSPNADGIRNKKDSNNNNLFNIRLLLFFKTLININQLYIWN